MLWMHWHFWYDWLSQRGNRNWLDVTTSAIFGEDSETVIDLWNQHTNQRTSMNEAIKPLVDFVIAMPFLQLVTRNALTRLHKELITKTGLDSSWSTPLADYEDRDAYWSQQITKQILSHLTAMIAQYNEDIWHQLIIIVRPCSRILVFFISCYLGRKRKEFKEWTISVNSVVFEFRSGREKLHSSFILTFKSIGIKILLKSLRVKFIKRKIRMKILENKGFFKKQFYIISN